MSILKSQIITVAVTLMLGAGIAVSWLHFRPLEIPRFARVDVGTIILQQQQSLAKRVKPEMDAAEKEKLFEEAKAFGVRLDAALEQVSKEKNAIEGYEDLTDGQMIMEKVLFGLRMNEGVPQDLVPLSKRDQVQTWVKDGFLLLESGNVKTTERGRLVLDELSARLI